MTGRADSRFGVEGRHTHRLRFGEPLNQTFMLRAADEPGSKIHHAVGVCDASSEQDIGDIIAFLRLLWSAAEATVFDKKTATAAQRLDNCPDSAPSTNSAARDARSRSFSSS